jgi:hypothetical protein
LRYEKRVVKTKLISIPAGFLSLEQEARALKALARCRWRLRKRLDMDGFTLFFLRQR